MNEVRFDQIELLQVAMRLRTPLVAAHGTIAERPIVLVRVSDENGIHGWGECVAFATPGYLSETVDTAWAALRNSIIPAVLDRAFESPDALAAFLAGTVPQAPVAAASIEMAAWDIVARRQGRSLSNLLGGTRTNIATGATIGILAPTEAGTAVAEAVRRGYRRVKMKVDPARARGISIEAVRAAGDIPVVVDANASFAVTDVPKLRELDATGIAWLEQPFPVASLRATADLRDSLRSPIALDESAGSVNAIRRIVEMGAAAALSIKPGRLGGIAAARTAYRLAREAGLSLWIGGMLETGIGRAHNLALASLAGFDVPGDMGPSAAYWERDLLVEPIEMAAGHIPVPTAYGIGVEVDTDYVDWATTRRERFS